ncbi:hypothetical protein BIFGAL_03729 [Bifidobacterium gallicum DSM 20093 = LMG 11596]|uniref:Uncharacterized protein n=1 Tax=Bifidobacterium gallicum DSM 20093 = LMG 11596 TaxID=561180 RepID=D1NV47_9BIFI|nr:hypothetical protein BIFGAL_03729 [Bifidobacterium gallicum DSM 20093 = LMG 11596]
MHSFGGMRSMRPRSADSGRTTTGFACCMPHKELLLLKRQ